MERDVIERAYEVLESVELTPQQLEALAAALPPKPQPTQADIELDWEEYYLEEVQDQYGLKGALVSISEGQVRLIRPEDGLYSYWDEELEGVTFTGRKYKLVLEDEQPAPQYMETKEEIDALPAGSIICEDGDDLAFVYLRGPLGWVDSNYEDPKKSMYGSKLRVLRVGWGSKQ